MYRPRFAQFFLNPLFTPSATEREVNAVNSENDKNVMNDARRLYQMDKATCNVNHDFHKFGTGKSARFLRAPQLIYRKYKNVVVLHKW